LSRANSSEFGRVSGFTLDKLFLSGIMSVAGCRSFVPIRGAASDFAELPAFTGARALFSLLFYGRGLLPIIATPFPRAKKFSKRLMLSTASISRLNLI